MAWGAAAASDPRSGSGPIPGERGGSETHTAPAGLVPLPALAAGSSGLSPGRLC